VWTAQRRSLLGPGIALAWMLLASPSRGFALNPALDISHYAHTAWKIREGFFNGTIYSITQTPDGYLWLGTEFGLLRFDGVRPVPWRPPPGQELPSSNIRRLLATRDGALWIGTDQGLARWKDGKLDRYDRLAGHHVGDLVEDPSGSIWATTFFNFKWTLCEIRPRDAECHGDDGGPGAGAIGLYRDRTGQLWAGTVGRSNGVWRWRPGPPRFYPLPQQANGIRGLSEDADGAPLIPLAGGVGRLVEGEPVIAYRFPASTRGLQFPLQLRDRDGALWLASASGGGLVHFHEGMTDTFASSDGLSGDSVYALYEDREGTIWVATVDGLDRFRDVPVATYSVKHGLSNANVASVFASRDGSIWIGTSDRLNRWTHGQAISYREPAAIGGIQSIFQDSLGRVWVSTQNKTGYLEHDRFVAVPALHGGLIRSIVEDGDGNVWIADSQLGLFRFSNRTGHIARTSWAELKHKTTAFAMIADRMHRGVWLGFPQGGIVHFVDDQVRASYGVAEGLGEGVVKSLRLDPDGSLWAATDGGLSRLRDGRLATLTRKNGLPCDATHWTIDDDVGTMWVATTCGLARIRRADLDAWTAAVHDNATANPPISVTVFGNDDGFRVFRNANYFSSPVAKSPDGKLWFVAPGGLSVVDPRHLPYNRLPPPVHIEQLIADRTIHEVTAVVRTPVGLPPLTRDLQIDYTALSLVAPDRVRFRYLLEGYDRDWQDAGTRRQAFYTNLPPRAYRFRVIAANNSGLWNETGTFVDFSVAPAYYQTTWFKALSLATVIALVCAVYRVRVKVVEKHEREISALNERMMKAQEQERIRIAGELHDGVMQEMLAVTMMLGTAKRRIPEDAEARATIDRAQQKLINVGTDIRQLSHDLHPPILQEAGLPEAMRTYCEQFAATSGIPVSCDADDDVRTLSRGAALALFRIIQEALGNAAKHARARRIAVRLARAGDVVSLEVSDDGAGFDPGRLATPGGLGLIMMRERASQLNGKFEFESMPGRGTTIRVAIPFR
jgi:signal transduction histidine kinase/ligand-binding sensor domain-containing protein